MTEEFKRLLDDLATLPIKNHHERVKFVIEDARSMAEHNEEVIGFENICQNIYEWDIPLSRSNYQRLERLGRHYGLAETTWSFLEKIVA